MKDRKSNCSRSASSDWWGTCYQISLNYSVRHTPKSTSKMLSEFILLQKYLHYNRIHYRGKRSSFVLVTMAFARLLNCKLYFALFICFHAKYLAKYLPIHPFHILSHTAFEMLGASSAENECGLCTKMWSLQQNMPRTAGSRRYRENSLF